MAADVSRRRRCHGGDHGDRQPPRCPARRRMRRSCAPSGTPTTAVAPTPPRLGGVPGTTDGTMLTALAGVPTVVYGPGGKWIAHQADEYVDVADIVEHANVYVDAAHRFLGGDARECRNQCERASASEGAASNGLRGRERNDRTAQRPDRASGVHVGHHQRRGRGWLTGHDGRAPAARNGRRRRRSAVAHRGPARPTPSTRSTSSSASTPCASRGQRLRPRRGRRSGALARRPQSWFPGRPGAAPRRADRAGGRALRPRRRWAVPQHARRDVRRTSGGRLHAPARFVQGTVGAGTGAHAERLKGGIGSASVVLAERDHRRRPRRPQFERQRVRRRALASCSGSAAASPGSSTTCAAPSRKDLAAHHANPPAIRPLNTTLAVIATDAALGKHECTRMAVSGQDGLARAIDPVHQYVDGDVVFTLATGDRQVPDDPVEGSIRPGSSRVRSSSTPSSPPAPTRCAGRSSTPPSPRRAPAG